MGRLATPGSAGRSPGSSRSVSFAVARRAVGAELHPVAEESSIGTFTASPPRIQGGLAGATSGDADWDRSGGPDIPTSGGFPSEVSTAAGAETSVADTSGGEASISNGGDGGSEDSESDGPGLWQRQKPGDGRETSGRSAATTSSAFSSGACNRKCTLLGQVGNACGCPSAQGATHSCMVCPLCQHQCLACYSVHSPQTGWLMSNTFACPPSEYQVLFQFAKTAHSF